MENVFEKIKRIDEHVKSVDAKLDNLRLQLSQNDDNLAAQYQVTLDINQDLRQVKHILVKAAASLGLVEEPEKEAYGISIDDYSNILKKLMNKNEKSKKFGWKDASTSKSA